MYRIHQKGLRARLYRNAIVSLVSPKTKKKATSISDNQRETMKKLQRNHYSWFKSMRGSFFSIMRLVGLPGCQSFSTFLR